MIQTHTDKRVAPLCVFRNQVLQGEVSGGLRDGSKRNFTSSSGSLASGSPPSQPY